MHIYSMSKTMLLSHSRLRKTNSLLSIIRGIMREYPDLIVRYTEKAGSMRDLASQLPAECSRLFIAGGDGSLHEAVNGLMAHTSRPLIYLIPLGSGNDFARSLGVSTKQYLSAWSSNSFHERAIDVLRISCKDKQGQDIVKYTINIADVGIGGEIAGWLHRIPGFLGPGLKYVFAVLFGFLRYKKRCFRLESEAIQFEGNALALCMANGVYFGNGLGIAPGADPSDGNITLACFGEVTLWDYIRYLPQIKRVEPVADSRVFYGKSHSLQIDCIAGPAPIDMDGELGGYTPLTAEIISGVLRFAVPCAQDSAGKRK